MFLLGKKIKGLSLANPFGNLPDLLKPEREKELVVKLKNNTITVEEEQEIIRAYLRLAMSIASKYAVCDPTKSDILIAEASYAVVLAVHTAKKGLWLKDNFTSYCAIYIHKYMAMLFKQRKNQENIDLEQLIIEGDYNYIDLLDEVCSLVQNEIEGEILKMSMYGFSGVEIANDLAMSTSRISQIKTEMEDRFCNKEKLLKD